jgi:hypothetical protein
MSGRQKHESLTPGHCRSKIFAVKQALVLSPYVLWLDADAVFTRFDQPVGAALTHAHTENKRALKQNVRASTP